MSEATLRRARRLAPERVLAAKVGAGVIVGAAAVATYAAYGDPHPEPSQESAVPFLATVATVVAVMMFGVVAPRVLRAIDAGARTASRWVLWHGIVAAVSTVAFWSGVPLVLGTAAVLLGAYGRRAASANGTRRYTLALALGLFAAVGSVALTVLGNTVR